jgi:hypothetical protein
MKAPRREKKLVAKKMPARRGKERNVSEMYVKSF